MMLIYPLIAWWCSSSLCKRLPEGNNEITRKSMGILSIKHGAWGHGLFKHITRKPDSSGSWWMHWVTGGQVASPPQNTNKPMDRPHGSVPKTRWKHWPKCKLLCLFLHSDLLENPLQSPIEFGDFAFPTICLIAMSFFFSKPHWHPFDI